MSILTYPLGFIGGGVTEFYTSVMENSVRLDGASSAYLHRTPATVSDTKTYTVSCWLKRTSQDNFGGYDGIFSAFGASNAYRHHFQFWTTQVLRIAGKNGGGYIADVATSAVFRDPSAWYHFVIVTDTNNATSGDRIRIFVNGQRLATVGGPGGGSQPSQGQSTVINTAIKHEIGHDVDYSTYADMHITDFYLIDGYALGPESFGRNKNGAWIPKEYAGPPPLITDSSPSEHFIDNVDAGGTVKLDYENFYIGNSSMSFDGSASRLEAGDSSDFDLGNNFTIDWWQYIHTLGSTMGIWGQFQTTGNRFQMYKGSNNVMALYIMTTGNNEGFSGDYVTDHSAIANVWEHWSMVCRDNVYMLYKNGVPSATETSSESITGIVAPFNIGYFMQSGHNDYEGLMDEFRITTGERVPPRFYFGTNYGNQDGGRLAHRATTADRFVDDERTVFLVSGQSANNHARAVSLVDESGFHADNVHFSNSTFTSYPTQDGVGKQFTISGTQQTTKESFIGNTSSIVFDQIDDRMEMTGLPTLDGKIFQVDFWAKPGKFNQGWNDVLGFNTGTGGNRDYFNHYTTAAPDYFELYTGSAASRDWYCGDDVQPNRWVHLSIVRDTTTESNIDLYINGKPAVVVGSGTNWDGNITPATHLEFGKRENSSWTYFDEFRYIVDSVDKPQIKWTHTQTAGAGNKDAYNVHGWRAHGHEFTDDNATKLLAHGDAYDTTSDAAVGFFKDSSSANSIHHALVSGGGVHHTKAVTLKSDGTNGTSTTDHLGNTIYWCGSNSTVTFANSSSFDYGNTSITGWHATDGTPKDSWLSAPASPDFSMGTGDFTMEMWVYCFNSVSTRVLFAMGEGDGRASTGTDSSIRFTSYITDTDDVGFFMQSGTNRVAKTWNAGIKDDSWHHINFTRNGTIMNAYVDGMIPSVDTTSTEIGGNSFGFTDKPFVIGTDTHYNAYMHGYFDEVRVIKGVEAPPRFYLGGGAAASDGTLESTKFMHFDGSNDCINLPNVGITGNSPWTIAAWVTMDDSSDRNMIFSWGGGQKARVDWEFGRVITNADYGLGVHFSGTSVSWKNSLDGMENSWMFVAAIYDGTTTYNTKLVKDDIYITDTVEHQSGTDGALNLVDINWVIGARNESESDGDGSGQFFDGRIAQVAIWDVELTQSALKDLWYKGPAGNWTVSGTNYTNVTTGELRGYWAIGNHDAIASGTYTRSASGDNSTGGTADATGGTGSIYDRSGNGKTGIIAGSRPLHTPATTVSMASKRLTYAIQHFDSAAATTLGTANLGNTHYANVAAQSVTSANFGGFVDDEYTVLLLRGGHADGNTAFFDGGVAGGGTITFPTHSYSYGKSRIAKTLTIFAGSPQYENTNALPLHGTSIKFDGTDSIQVVESGTLGDDFWFEDGDFCVEGWFRSTNSTTAYGFGQSNSSEHANTGALRFSLSGSNLNSGMVVRGGSRAAVGTVSITATASFTLNTWYHVAIQRHASQLQEFVNGVGKINHNHKTTANWNNVHLRSPAKFCVGSWGEIANNRWIGEIDEFRVTKGIARYTPAGDLQSGIVPAGSEGYAGDIGTAIPTSSYLRPTPFLAADGGRGYFANTNVKLWIKSDTYPGSTAFTDFAGSIGQSAKTITNAGHTSAARPTLQTGTGDYALSGGSDAMYFDGSNDYIEIAAHENWNFGIGDFTVELWVKLNSRTTEYMFLGTGGEATGGDRQGWGFESSGTQDTHFSFGNDTSPQYLTTSDMPDWDADIWMHLAVVRDGSTISMFKDGVCRKSATTTENISAGLGNLFIARADWSPNSAYKYFNGKMDEIRISKMARYTGQGLVDSAYPNPSTEFGIQTEGSSYGQFDTQVTANTTYQRYNYQHTTWKNTNFNGTDEYLTKSVSNWNVSSNRGTISAWWNTDAVNAWRYLFSSGDAATTNYFFAYGITDAGKMVLEITDAGETDLEVYFGATGEIKVGTWHHTVLVHDGTAITHYLDGYLQTAAFQDPGTNQWFHSIDTERDNLNIGAMVRSSASAFWDGKIAQLAIWGGSSGTTGVLTAAQIATIHDLGPGADLTTSYATGMVGYWTFGNKTTQGTDTAGTMYDQSAASDDDLTGVNVGGQTSDTKLLIHSNTDIDGDTSIVDSSPSEHVIDRVVADPQYANTNTNRTVLGYDGVLFKTNGLDYLKVWTQPLELRDDWTVAFWVKFKESSSGTTNVDKWFFSAGAGSGVDGGLALRNNGSSALEGYNDYGSSQTSSGANLTGTGWYHIAWSCHDNAQAGAIKLYRNGSLVDTDNTSGSVPPTGGVAWGGIEGGWADLAGNTNGHQFYIDQMIFIKGHALSSTEVTNLYNSANGNTAIGLLGGLVVHEEFANTTVTQNTFTECLIHSNNATHHTPSSRTFYNDTANCVFKGTTGHAHAGYFNITAASGVWKFSGNTSQRSIGGTSTAAQPMSNPSVRLKRGYSYIFDFSEGTSTGHKFYFANSTANSTGYAYGADTGYVNEYITGLYGSHTAPTFANKGSLTWTAFATGHHGSYDGDADGPMWKHVKFEVPTDAPKDLYYRCATSGHQAMGNAVFVMEATEPEPVKVGNLPTLKTSTWNDRDYAGIGTNKSVIAFNSSNQYLSLADSADWHFSNGEWWVDFWVYDNGESTAHGYIAQWTSGNKGWALWYNDGSSGKIQFSYSTNGTGQVEIDIGATSIVSDNKWEHFSFGKSGSNFVFYLNGVQRVSSSLSATLFDSTYRLEIGAASGGAGYFDGFIDEVMIYKGVGFTANTVIEHYQTNRAGNHNIANSACVLHVKADSTYGDTTFTDSSRFAHTITNVGGVYHHIDDNRTANTALYFDGASYIGPIGSASTIGAANSVDDMTLEAWVKPTQTGANICVFSHGDSGASTYGHISLQLASAPYNMHYYVGGGGGDAGVSAGSITINVWQHIAIVREAGVTRYFNDGICVYQAPSGRYDDNKDHDAGLYIGAIHYNGAVQGQYFVGWMDGVRYTKGIPRYTSGIPTDGQSPHKQYDDGRSSNVYSNTWATSSTRRYYGINTRTYLQTSEYAINANTVLMVRGDDTVTANDGVNMYGENGFHLEFKEVGAGTNRDYNNFRTGAAGLGSDTSSTQEFADEKTIMMARSRPNQANGSIMFVDETNQNTAGVLGTSYHTESASIFGVDSNTANVSIASGGTRSY